MALKTTHADARKLVRNNLDELAPRFRAAVRRALEDCGASGFPVKVYEALRTNELAKMYFDLGVSKAKNGFRTWHFYGLAVDIIHPVHGWDWWESQDEQAVNWRTNVVRTFKMHGMDWGGDWQSFRDRPHFQWGLCKASPSQKSIDLVSSGGREAVWKAVGAL
jgi:hypothetical protein